VGFTDVDIIYAEGNMSCQDVIEVSQQDWNPQRYSMRAWVSGYFTASSGLAPAIVGSRVQRASPETLFAAVIERCKADQFLDLHGAVLSLIVQQ